MTLRWCERLPRILIGKRGAKIGGVSSRPPRGLCVIVPGRHAAWGRGEHDGDGVLTLRGVGV